MIDALFLLTVVPVKEGVLECGVMVLSMRVELVEVVA